MLITIMNEIQKKLQQNSFNTSFNYRQLLHLSFSILVTDFLLPANNNRKGTIFKFLITKFDGETGENTKKLDLFKGLLLKTI